MRKPRYGEIQSLTNPEAHRIWLTRDEVPPEESLPSFWEPEVDDYHETLEERVSASQMWALIESSLSKRDAVVLILYHVSGLTFREIGEKLNLSADRIKQIESRARCRAWIATEETRHRRSAVCRSNWRAN